tara:strand:+ start:242 stop:961 length:720 start_codon:yes stop_codon:yes gene_type:complete
VLENGFGVHFEVLRPVVNGAIGERAKRASLDEDENTSHYKTNVIFQKQLGAFLKSSEEIHTPDLEFHVQPLSLEAFGSPLHKFPAITTSICNLRPTSRGEVTLGKNLEPEVDPQYLSTENDRKIASDSIRLSRACVSVAGFAEKYEPTEILPGATITSTEELAEAAGKISSSIFHPVGTCKMGIKNDPNAVVDNELRVFGVANLYIVDASVMPNIVSGNTCSPTLAIAEKASRMMIANK